MTQIYWAAEDSYLLQDCLKKELPRLLKQNFELKFLEIGCGSGVQLKMAKKLGVKDLLGADIDSESVEHCKRIKFKTIHSNLFSKVKGKFDLIIFNPPYLPEDKREDKESQLATTGGKQGSEIINKFLKQSEKHLEKDGRIFLLISSLTKGIDWLNYKRKLIVEKKLFFEKLSVWELKLKN